MGILKLAIVSVVIASAALFGQTPAFEVVSIKPAQGGAIGLFTYPGGRIIANSMTLELLMEEAFDVQPFQLSGGPAWMRKDRYQIEAKPPASSMLSKANPSPPDRPNEEQRQMLQALLADRFQLKIHREAKDGAIYLLVKGNKALKLQAPKNKDEAPWAGGLGGGNISGDGLAGKNISMPQLAKRLSTFMGRPVIDKTSLEGSFDFLYEQVSDDPHPDVAAWIITSVQELGLKLEASRVPVETIIVDHLERPSSN
jgi:uncharacterized protein (TIGR03435 family)